MEKWEYKLTTKSEAVSTSELNQYGAEGWELVSTSYNPESYQTTLYFKRPLQTKSTAGASQ